jgi:glycerol-3-phosphate dehydrogenase
MIRPSQGVHLVLERSFLPGDAAVMVPHTDDGRVLFVIPWKGRVLVGTTDTPVDEAADEPKPMAEEVAFLLEHAARYLRRDPKPADVLSAFAGVRPLVRTGERVSTASVARDHTVHVSRGGLVTIAGGKWTTYRKMAEDAVDHAALVGELPERPCITRELAIGDPASALEPKSVAAAAKTEMARTVEDVLARRSRDLLLDARTSLAKAPAVARELAESLGHDSSWEHAQVESYAAVVRDHLCAPA